jgi:[acyl-carrier-protein] S-malonyltransferase
MMTDNNRMAFLFPGQGSQAVGMGKDLANQYSACGELFEQANEILGFQLSRLMWEGPAEILNDTVNTQPALFVHSMAALKLFELQVPGIKPAFLAGHSLGEISAMAGAGAISFEEGLKLVHRRGELMKRAGEISPGGMAAVLGMDVDLLDEICVQASSGADVVQIANDNCPGQIVISGSRSALEKISELAKSRGARKIIPLAVSIAAHSNLMNNAKEDFKEAIDNVAGFAKAEIEVISNVHATPIHLIEDMKKDLLDQLTSRVRWTETIQYMLLQGVSSFIEMGSGNVLTGLLKRIDGKCHGFSLGTAASLTALKHEMDVSSRM